MDVFQCADCFQLYDNLILDEEVEAMFTNLVILVEKRDRFLSNELNSTKCEFDGQGLLVYGLEKSRTQLAMNPNRSGDYSLRQFGISQLPSCFPAFLIHLQIVPAVAVSSWPGLRLSGIVAISWWSINSPGVYSGGIGGGTGF